MKNSNDAIGNRTRILLACSAVPQPTAPPRAPVKPLRNLILYSNIHLRIYTALFIKNVCQKKFHFSFKYLTLTATHFLNVMKVIIKQSLKASKRTAFNSAVTFFWKSLSLLTHCGRVTQICVFNTVKLGTSASSP